MFADLWHDSSDGLPLYSRIKSIMRKKKREEDSSLICRYWIENSILSRLRWLIYSEAVIGKSADKLSFSSYEDIERLLSNESLAVIAPDVRLASN
jgi:predicted transcriptional regulator